MEWGLIKINLGFMFGISNPKMMSWLCTSMTSSITINCMLLSSAHANWETSKESYLKRKDTATIHETRTKLAAFKQGNNWGTNYYNS